MHRGFSTIIAPLLEALRPLVAVDVADDDGYLAVRVAEYMAAWGGEVRALRQAPDDCGLDGTSVRVIPTEGAGFDALRQCGDAELAILHGDANWWTVRTQLEALAAASKSAFPVVLVGGTDEPTGRRDRYSDPERIPAEARQPYELAGSYWQAVDHSTPRNGVLTAIEDFIEHTDDLQAVCVPGFGGVAVLCSAARASCAPAGFSRLMDDLQFNPVTRDHVIAMARQIHEQAVLTDARETRLRQLEADREQYEGLRHEAAELRKRMGELTARVSVERSRLIDAEVRAVRAEHALRAPRETAGSRTPAPGAVAKLSQEPSSEDIRKLLRPLELLEALGWPGPETELSLPIPNDIRSVVDGDADNQILVRAGEDSIALRETICSITDRAGAKVRLGIVVPSEADHGVALLARRLVGLVPGSTLVGGVNTDADLILEAGEEIPWGWPLAPSSDDVRAAYLLPGLAPEGSGGSHSIVQEARGLKDLGADARVCLPQEAMDRAVELYGNADRLFVAYSEDAGIVEAVGEATVAVATDNRSSPMLALLNRALPRLATAYYVQDYEPLFTSVGSSHSDRALLSYRAVAGARLFAKSYWLRNLLAARHNVAVAKVPASLSSLFTSGQRPEDPGASLRIAAMIRPRTPRRRPLATLQALTLVERALGDRVRTITFGCPEETGRALAAQVGSRAEHLGLLDSEQVAELLLESDLFLDGSAYQAFGRTGLEAMGCGAVPLLPRLGGTAEYAVDGVNAIVVADGTAEILAATIVRMARDRDRLSRMSIAGRETAAQITVRHAAEAQLSLFSNAMKSNFACSHN